MANNALLPAKGKKKKKQAIPKTVQQTIPYVEAYENGTMQVEPGLFSGTFEYEDISFKTASDEEQETIYEHYMKFLNTIGAKEDIVFSFVNGIENEKAKLERVAPIMRGDAVFRNWNLRDLQCSLRIFLSIFGSHTWHLDLYFPGTSGADTDDPAQKICSSVPVKLRGRICVR